MKADPAVTRLSAGLDRDEQLARAATELPKVTPRYPEKRPPWEPEEWAPARDDVRTVNGAADPLREDGGTRSRAVAVLMAEFDPARALGQVEAIRKNVITPYLAAVNAVEATVSARRDAATRHTLAALRLDHASDEDLRERQAQERQTREELLSAEVQLASDVAARVAYTSVIRALAAIYSDEPEETS